MAHSIVLNVSYDGAPFAGFARQPDRETVQGRLEEALGSVLRRDVEIVGAGRTDAGVHALGQVVSFDARGDEPESVQLARSVDALVRPHIAVTGVRHAVEGFSARHSALLREYRYLLVPGPARPVFLSPYAWWPDRRLDVDAMHAAASELLGRHDFRSFCVASSADQTSTVREIDALDIAQGCEMGERCVSVRVEGRSFLHSMVRIVVGSLVEVGSGKRPPSWMAEALDARDRTAAGPTAPAHGLTLWRVTYPATAWSQGS